MSGRGAIREGSDGCGVGAALAVFAWAGLAACSGGAGTLAVTGEEHVILVLGFGAFDGIDDNPASVAARALDGRALVSPSGRRIRLVGREIPVSYARGVADAIAVAQASGAELVVGIGVDESRDDVYVEAVARGQSGPYTDVDGATRAVHVGLVPATLHPGRLAEALGAEISVNAGDYVCNAWLWDVSLALAPIPVGFVHLPRSGIDPDRLAKAVARVADKPLALAPG